MATAVLLHRDVRGAHIQILLHLCRPLRAPAPMLRTTVATALLAAARAEVYDVVMEHYTSGCAHGCLDWSKVPDFLDPGTVVKDKNGTVITPPHQVSVGSLFADGQVPAGIGASCAMPAA
eukprot:COSAG01_NODE_36931_length_510_cov_5.309002_1_plen_119_part_10